MATNEEIHRAVSMAYDKEFGHVADYGAQYSGPLGQKYGSQGGPVCAHLTVGYVRQYLGAGKERGWWQCTECDQKFVALGPTPPAGYNGH